LELASSAQGIFYSVLTGICVGAGTIAFFLSFQKGGPLAAVPAVLAGGAAIMAFAGILFFHEASSWQRLLDVTLAIAGCFCCASNAAKEAAGPKYGIHFVRSCNPM
jgi:bacterial/archaeal transporter family protein